MQVGWLVMQIMVGSIWLCRIVVKFGSKFGTKYLLHNLVPNLVMLPTCNHCCKLIRQVMVSSGFVQVMVSSCSSVFTIHLKIWYQIWYQFWLCYLLPICKLVQNLVPNLVPGCDKRCYKIWYHIFLCLFAAHFQPFCCPLATIAYN